MKSKKLAIYLICFICLPSLLFSAWALREEQSSNLFIEDFEYIDDIDQSIWWFADKVKPFLILGSKDSKGKRWLRLTGISNNWYVGSFGKWIAHDATQYNALRVLIRGTGSQSGRLSIMLDQDNSHHCNLEVDKNWEPIHDDRFEYNLKINWLGWRMLTIPIDEFYISNPRAGIGFWDPEAKDGSCGLRDIQFVLFTTDKIGKTDIGIGKIELIKY